MRLPNGYGSVTKLSGKRRKPYMVRKTIGYHYDKALDRQVQDIIIIGYATTKNEGLAMLASYNNHPFDVDLSKMTVAEVYDKWSADKFDAISKSNTDSYKASFKSISCLHNRRIRDLRLSDLEEALKLSGKNYPSLKKIKVLLGQLYNYSIKNDICEKNYSQFIDLSPYKGKNPNKLNRDRLTNKEIKLLWEQKDDPDLQIALMLVYTGVRIRELIDLKKENVHIDEQYFEVTKSKTENGVRRVPINDAILPIFKEWYYSSDESFEFLLHTSSGCKMDYKNYYKRNYVPKMDALGIQKTPHCCRHTFITLMAEKGVDARLLKTIVGHSGGMSTTEMVYTHLSVQTLVDAVNKIA